MLSREIWIFAEFRDLDLSPVTLELLGAARKLSKELKCKACACILGSKIRECISILGDNGAEKIYFSDHKIFSEHNSPDVHVEVLQDMISEYKPLLMMFDASSGGLEIAARISWRMRLPLVTEVKRIDRAGESLVISKSCFDDKVYRNVRLRSEKTVILTVLPQDMDSRRMNISGDTELVELKPKREEMGGIRSRLINFQKGDPKKISLDEADRIVAGGKGIGKEISALEELADALGAAVGGTRPLVDEGVIPFERQIGITGKSVTPSLLFTFGISGAREFSAGTEKARLTIAVNIDEKAAIFKNADLKIHGDLREIIPALMGSIQKKKGSSQ